MNERKVAKMHYTNPEMSTCPKCDRTSIFFTGEYEFDSTGEAWCEMECTGCAYMWYELCKFTGLEEAIRQDYPYG